MTVTVACRRQCPRPHLLVPMRFPFVIIASLEKLSGWLAEEETRREDGTEEMQWAVDRSSSWS